MPLSWGFIISHISCVFMYVYYVTVFLLLLLMVILLVILMLVKNSRCPYVGHNSRNHCLIKSCKKFISRILLYVLINSLMTLLLRNLTSFKFLAKYMSFSSIYWSAASFFFLDSYMNLSNSPSEGKQTRQRRRTARHVNPSLSLSCLFISHVDTLKSKGRSKR